MNKLINFQVNLLFKYLEINLDTYPKIKKNKKYATVSPTPNYLLSIYKKFFDTFPTNTPVSD